jgi:hypothetical protein
LHTLEKKIKGDVCLRAGEANCSPIFVSLPQWFQFYDIIGPVGYILGI